MLFNSAEYAIFLVVVFVLFWLLSRLQVVRLLLLLVASYLFYASWSPSYLLLIVLSSAIDFGIGLGMGQAKSKGVRKVYLLASLCANLGILAVFKYFNFFMDSVETAMTYGGWQASVPHLDILLPVGISFYTFQTLSYSIDIYRGELAPCRNPLKFFVYVSFFPQLVAGPIVRAVDFLPQLDQDPTLSGKDASRASLLILAGLLKKVAIGDYLAVNLVDRVFDTPHMFSSLEVLLGVYGYAMQIYCDFSGYTDIAIGSALLLGFHLPINFNRPYQSHSLQDFWRRWHISLSSWLRDYLYISMGGSKKGNARTYLNLLITMLLGGLWHGAAWNFILWGAMHGSVLAITRAFQRWTTRLRSESEVSGKQKQRVSSVWFPRYEHWSKTHWYRGFSIFLTFQFVCVTWIFFRATTFEGAMAVIGRIAELQWGTTNIAPMVGAVLLVGYLAHWSPVRWKEELKKLFVTAPVVVQAIFVALIVLFLRQVATSDVVPFLYFQF